MTPWPHQIRFVEDVLAAIRGGFRRIAVTAPTGAGKTWSMEELIRQYLAEKRKVVLYSNRKMLIEQISGRLMGAGITHGVRASGYEQEQFLPVQLSSMATENSRVLKKGQWSLHAADLVLVDEGHLQSGPVAKQILDRHHQAGAAYVLVTATPMGLAELCDLLIVACKVSDCFKCGALVPAIHYAPDEPDMQSFRKLQAKLESGEQPSETEARKAIMTPKIFGRVWSNFERLNPDRRPTILFAPGVRESLWFAEQFKAKGVNAAHIDGERIWVDGEFHATSPEVRQQVLDGSRCGDIKVVCNRFVLREGIDCPWLSHGILATMLGFQSYLQAGGRLLRSFPGLEHVTIQDHGGHWHRHGSLNADLDWTLDCDAATMCGLRAERMRSKKSTEPFLCPRCQMVWGRGRVCNPARGGCGHVLDSSIKARPVVSADGTLKMMSGDVFQPRRIMKHPKGPEIWEKMYWRSRSAGTRTFRAAMALFAYENNWGWPDRRWPLMPVNDIDLFRRVADVPMGRLIGGEHEP